jgi:hypothetical protein
MQLPDASTTPDGDVPELIDADKYLEELEKRRKEVTRRDNESG